MATEVISLIMTFTDQVSRGLDAVSSKVDTFRGKVDKIAAGFAPLSIAAGAAMAGSIQQAASFDKSIQTAVRALDLGGKEVKEFEKTVMDLQKELKYQFSAETLARLAAEAGKLGIAKNEVDDFTRVMSKLAVATDQVKNVEELSTNMAKISTTMHLTVPQLEQFGAAVNKLDDTTSATSNEIINFTKRVSGVGASAKLSAQQLAAWGATLISSGQAPNVAATFMNKFLTVLGTADNLSTKASEGLIKLGIDGRELAVAFDKDASGAMQSFMNKLKQMSTLDQRNIIASIFGQEHVDSAMQLLSVWDKVGVNMKAAADQAGNAAKMQAEFNKASASFAGISAEFQNRLGTIGIQLGQILLPGLIAIMRALTPMLDALQQLVATNPMISSLIVTALGAVAVVTPILMIVSALTSLIGLLPVIGAGFAAVAVAIGAIAAPALAVIGIITAIGAAAYAIIKNWTPISTFFVNLWNGAITQGNRFLTWVWEGGNKFEAAINRWFANLPNAINNAVKAGVNQINSFLNWLAGLGNNFAHMAESWGNGLIQGFINGMQSMYGNVQNAMNNFVNWLSQYLPHSDAKKGALSNLTASGQSFADTFLSGIEGAKIDPFGTLSPALANSSIPPMSALGGGSSSLNYAPIYNISAKDADDIMKQIKARDRELLDLIARATQRTDRRAY